MTIEDSKRYIISRYKLEMNESSFCALSPNVWIARFVTPDALSITILACGVQFVMMEDKLLPVLLDWIKKQVIP